MAKYHYRVNGETKWQSLSGTAILAVVNKSGSGKKIDINSFQIYPQTFFGASITAGTYPTTVPTMFKIIPVTALGGGTTWTGAKLDTSASSFPSTVQVKTKTTYTPEWIDVWGSLTDGTVAIGDVTFTPGTSPAWTTSQLVYNGCVLNVASGGNAGQYRINANIATALTIETPGFPAAVSTTGTIQQMKHFCNVGVVKNFSVSGNNFSQHLGKGRINGRNNPSGQLWGGTSSTDLQRIKIRQGEKIALVTYPIHTSLPVQIELKLTVEGTPNRTYQFSTFTNLLTENEAVFSIDNNASSGEVIRIDSVKIMELGTFDTPYFQLVPLGPIDPFSISDPDKKLSVTTYDTNTPALSSSVCEIFTNAPVLPQDPIPQSYIAEGSAGVPKGYNYLNTKDFIGPSYMNVFLEGAPIGGNNLYLGNWTAGSSGYMSRSMKLADIKPKGSPISIRDGEQIGLVSGAETATGATAVPQSGWHSYFFAIDMSVEDATTITVTVLDSAGVAVQNARVYVEKVSDNSSILNSLTNASGVVTSTYDFPGSDVAVRIRVRKSSGSPKYVPYETLGTITNLGMVSTCVLSVDSIA